jgi:hypothetical protein
MFDWFKNKKLPNNVVPFPKSDYIPPVPKTEPPKEKPVTVYYRLGLTDNSRVSLTMGYSEITMNKDGCQNMIDQLTLFMNQLPDTEVAEDDE